MGLADRQQQYYEQVRAYLAGLCPPSEPLVGAVVTSRVKAFGGKVYAIGVTANWMVLQPLDRRQSPEGAPVWLGKQDIVQCTLWGQGGGVREWLADDSEFQLRFSTPTEKYKFMAIGGWTMGKMMGEDYLHGLEAVAAWLASTRR